MASAAMKGGVLLVYALQHSQHLANRPTPIDTGLLGRLLLSAYQSFANIDTAVLSERKSSFDVTQGMERSSTVRRTNSSEPYC